MHRFLYQYHFYITQISFYLFIFLWNRIRIGVHREVAGLDRPLHSRREKMILYFRGEGWIELYKILFVNFLYNFKFCSQIMINLFFFFSTFRMKNRIKNNRNRKKTFIIGTSTATARKFFPTLKVWIFEIHYWDIGWRIHMK